MKYSKWSKFVSVFLVVALLLGSFSLFACAEAAPTLSYRAHVAEDGWMSTVSAGKTAGTTGKTKAMEALRIYLKKADNTSCISYRAHVADIGWQGWVSSGKTAGTTGKAKAIEAIQIKLTNGLQNTYDVFYRAHVAGVGWQSWVGNGATAGTTGKAKAIEAIQIKLIKKPTVRYRTHIQDKNWTSWYSNGSTSGTTGNSLRMEAMQITATNSQITYRAHVANIGWQSWVSSGETSGTTGKSYAIEAVQIKLTSTLSTYYNVYYRLHVAEKGWLGWAKNGSSAGTVGGSRRAEAIQIKIVPKGTSFSTGGQAFFDETYNVTAAVNYALAHAKDGQGLCAEFVSKCVAQGGIKIPNQSYYSSSSKSLTGNALGAYTNPYIASEAQLKWFSEKGYKVIKNPSYSQMSLGDLVYNTNDGDDHVVIITGFDTDGRPLICAHNRAYRNQRLWAASFLVKLS